MHSCACGCACVCALSRRSSSAPTPCFEVARAAVAAQDVINPPKTHYPTKQISGHETETHDFLNHGKESPDRSRQGPLPSLQRLQPPPLSDAPAASAASFAPGFDPSAVRLKSRKVNQNSVPQLATSASAEEGGGSAAEEGVVRWEKEGTKGSAEGRQGLDREGGEREGLMEEGKQAESGGHKDRVNERESEAQMAALEKEAADEVARRVALQQQLSDQSRAVSIPVRARACVGEGDKERAIGSEKRHELYMLMYVNVHEHANIRWTRQRSILRANSRRCRAGSSSFRPRSG